jgi:hypothetical protein
MEDRGEQPRGKGLIGLDQHQVRTWTALHHPVPAGPQLAEPGSAHPRRRRRRPKPASPDRAACPPRPAPHPVQDACCLKHKSAPESVTTRAAATLTRNTTKMVRRQGASRSRRSAALVKGHRRGRQRPPMWSNDPSKRRSDSRIGSPLRSRPVQRPPCVSLGLERMNPADNTFNQ